MNETIKSRDAHRIKVLCIFESFSCAGGVEQMGLVLAKFIDRDKFCLDYCCINEKNGPFGKKIEQMGFKIYDLKTICNLNPMNNLKILWRLYHLFKRERPQVVQTYDMKPNLLGRIAAKCAGIPVVIATEVLEPDQRESRRFYSLSHKIKTISWPVMNRLNILLHKYSDKVIVLSEKARKCRVGKNNSNKFETIYSVFDMESFRGQSGAVLNSIVPKGQQPVIVTVARMDPAKGHINLLKAMPSVLERFAAARLILIGDGPYKEVLKKYVMEMNLNNAVEFKGYVENLPMQLSSSDIFVLPTLSEGFPITIMEAMAMDLPVVASRVGAISELVLDKQTGILVEPENPEALDDDIIDLLSHPDDAKKMGQAGRDRIHSMFHPKKGIEQMEALYERLVIEKNPNNNCPAA